MSMFRKATSGKLRTVAVRDDEVVKPLVRAGAMPVPAIQRKSAWPFPSNPPEKPLPDAPVDHAFNHPQK